MVLRTLQGTRRGKVFWVKSAQYTPRNITILEPGKQYYVWISSIHGDCVIWKAIKVEDMET